jgi:hypothetical protein
MTSNSSFFERLSIDQLASGLDLTPQEGVPDRLLGKRVHPASEEKLELVREVQECPFSYSSLIRRLTLTFRSGAGRESSLQWYSFGATGNLSS